MLLVVGIISMIACILSFLYAALNRNGYYNLHDGESDMYMRMHKRMIVFFVIGIIFAMLGMICIFCELKM